MIPNIMEIKKETPVFGFRIMNYSMKLHIIKVMFQADRKQPYCVQGSGIEYFCFICNVLKTAWIKATLEHAMYNFQQSTAKVT